MSSLGEGLLQSIGCKNTLIFYPSEFLKPWEFSLAMKSCERPAFFREDIALGESYRKLKGNCLLGRCLFDAHLFELYCYLGVGGLLPKCEEGVGMPNPPISNC